MAADKFIGHFASGGAYVIFGLNIVFCKDIANSGIISPIAMFALRAAGAAALFWIVSLLTPPEKVCGKDFALIALASIMGLFIPQLTFLAAITMTTAIDSAILSTLAPVFTMLVAAIFVKEPITIKKASGVALSFGGVIFLIMNSIINPNGIEQSKPIGIILILANCLSFASYLGIFRPLICRYSVITLMKWMFLTSLLLSLPFAMKDITKIRFSLLPENVCLELGFVIVFATFVAYFLIPVGQKNIRPTLVSMYTYLQPMIATGAAIATGIDTINWQKIIATVLIISGVILVNKSRAGVSDKH